MKLAEVAPKRWFRVAIAAAFVLGHLVAFTVAGHSRLHLPFNSAPGEGISAISPIAPSY